LNGKHSVYMCCTVEQPEAVPWTDGPALPMSGIITGAGGGAVVLVKRIPSPSIIAYSKSI